MKNKFKILQEVLDSLSGDIYYMPNGGNWGDGLIREGTIKFFDDIKLNYKEIPFQKNFNLPRNSTFIYGGGGAWCSLWSHGKEIVERASKQCQRVIVLPSTYDIEICKATNIDYFSRDKFKSLDYCPDAHICSDMALYLDKLYLKPTAKKGYFYRTDDESFRNFKLPHENRDISLERKHMYPCAEFIEGIGKYEIVYTDRLHVAIAGYLLDRKVFLKSSSYHKIGSFYYSWFFHCKNIYIEQ